MQVSFPKSIMDEADRLTRERGYHFAAYWLASLAQDAILAALVERGSLPRLAEPEPVRDQQQTLAAAFAEIERQTGARNNAE